MALKSCQQDLQSQTISTAGWPASFLCGITRSAHPGKNCEVDGMRSADKHSACVQSTGVEFPEVTTLWDGDKMRSVGAGVRAKKFGFLPVKVNTE